MISVLMICCFKALAFPLYHLFFSAYFPPIIYPLMSSFLPCIFTKPTRIKYKIPSSLFQLIMAFYFSLTEAKLHRQAPFSLVFVALHSLFLPRSSQDNRAPSGMTDRKNIFVGAQVLQMTFGVYVCTPLCIPVHVFAYWLCAGCWPFADKAWSSGGPLVAGWYCLSVMPGSLGSCLDP